MPTPAGEAPRRRMRPSARVSVITGDAAGRNLYSSEYLVYEGLDDGTAWRIGMAYLDA